MFNLKSPPIIIEDSFVSRHILYKKRMRAFKTSCFFSSLIFEGPCHETAKKLQASLLLVILTTAVYSAVISLTSLKKLFDATTVSRIPVLNGTFTGSHKNFLFSS